MEERLGCWNESVEVAQIQDALHEVDDLINGETGHHDSPHRFKRLVRGGHVLAVHASVTLGHGQTTALEIEVCGSERQHLAQTESASMQQLEGDERLRLAHDLLAEAQVLVLWPEAHLISLLVADLGRRILCESVVADGVVEHGRELVADRV